MTASRPEHPFNSSGSHLAKLLRHATALDDITATTRRLLPPVVAPHCRAAAFHKKKLTLFLDSSIWTTHIRFHQTELMTELKRRFGMDIRRIDTKVMPRSVPAPVTASPRTPMSDESRALLRSTARGIRDADLADALTRLANNGR